MGNAAGAAASVLAAVGSMEAVRTLPPASQIEAVRGIAATGEVVDRADNAVM